MTIHQQTPPRADAAALVNDKMFDRLADIMLDADELLEMLRSSSASSTIQEIVPARLQRIEPVVQNMYERVNDFMKMLGT